MLWDQTGVAEPLHRVRKSNLPSDEFLFKNGIAAITSYMAIHKLSDFDEALSKFGRAAHAYHLREAKRSGKTLDIYADERALEKARRYNLRRASERREQRADDYRKLRDGE